MFTCFVCHCVLAGTAACQHCSNNPNATDIWTNSNIKTSDCAGLLMVKPQDNKEVKE